VPIESYWAAPPSPPPPLPPPPSPPTGSFTLSFDGASQYAMAPMVSNIRCITTWLWRDLSQPSPSQYLFDARPGGTEHYGALASMPPAIVQISKLEPSPASTCRRNVDDIGHMGIRIWHW
jgi:hypothetical protein